MCGSGEEMAMNALVGDSEKEKGGKSDGCERTSSGSTEYEGILQKTSHYQIILPYYYRISGCSFYQYRLTDKISPISVYDLREVKYLEKKSDLDFIIQFHQSYKLELHSNSSSDCQSWYQILEQFHSNNQKVEIATLVLNKFTYFLKLEIYDQVLDSPSFLPRRLCNNIKDM
jgi:hypothetical protein